MNWLQKQLFPWFRKNSRLIILLLIVLCLCLAGFIGLKKNSLLNVGESSNTLLETSAGQNVATEDSKATEPVKEPWEDLDLVKESLTVEAGVDGIDATDFLLPIDPKIELPQVQFSGDLSKINLNVPGKYPLQIKIGHKVYDSVLIVEDTIAPVLKLKDLIEPLHREMKPEDFVEKLEDNTEVTFSFVTKPDSSSKDEQTISIKAVDLGNNETIEVAKIRFVALVDRITIEAGSAEPLTIENFFINDTIPENIELVTKLNALVFRHVEEIPVTFLVDGKEVISIIQVIDTIKPQATSKKVTAYIGNVPDASAFVTNIVDATDVLVSYVRKPDFTKKGTFDVRVKLTDEGGNSIELDSTVEIFRDETPPQLHGVRDFAYYPEDGRDFMAGVYATDNHDPNPKVSVDTSKVNEEKAGTYSVVYTARDAAGNETKKTARVTVKLRTPYEPKASTGNGQLDTMADAVLKSIINGDMSQYQQAYAIYNWLSSSLNYRAQTNRSDMISGGLQGLGQRNGDCYVYRFTNQALLTRAGIPNYGMNADGGGHSWTMITAGGRTFVSDPLWHYFDVSLSVVQERANRDNLEWWESKNRTIQKTENIENEIPFEIIRKENANMIIGEEKVVQTGVNGLENVIYNVTYKNDEEIDRVEVGRSTIRKVVNEIVEYGTKNTPPVFSGVRDQTINIGDSIDFRKGVRVLDKQDTNLSFSVDPGNFDNMRAGSYRITYRTKDSHGAVATATATVTVIGTPSESTVPTESMDPSTPTDPSGTTEPSKPTEPSGTTMPTESTTTTLPTEPTEPSGTTISTEPTGTTMPTEPTATTLPSKPTEPTGPSGTTIPTEPSGTTISTEPTRPS